MAGWSEHQGKAVALPLNNIDTDQLIPARFMSVPRKQGYGSYLLHDLRRGVDGELRKDFSLNNYPEASILVAGNNFGSGSSREAAVYALVDAGIRAVIAPGFGDIFAGNAINNGLLPARISGAEMALMCDRIGNGFADVRIDLLAGMITLGDLAIAFQLDESWRTKLVNGWDDIDLTLQYGADIASYRQNRFQIASWAWPAQGG